MFQKQLLGIVTVAAVASGCSHNPSTDKANSTTPAKASNVACKETSETEIASLFDRWNASLQTGDPKQVVANYAEKSILLPTVSNKPRLTPAEKEDYFHHFLMNKPSGVITKRHIQIGCNNALDAGLYTFTMGATGKKVDARYSYTYHWDGEQWLISSHHSSAMPEKTGAKATAH